jgi:hypothetical protein
MLDEPGHRKRLRANVNVLIAARLKNDGVCGRRPRNWTIAIAVAVIVVPAIAHDVRVSVARGRARTIHTVRRRIATRTQNHREKYHIPHYHVLVTTAKAPLVISAPNVSALSSDVNTLPGDNNLSPLMRHYAAS